MFDGILMKKMLYRIQQFIKAITAKVSEEEKQWISQQLSKAECELFFKLKVHEQRHCIDVAKVLSVNPRENHEMIRLGLLHDIGKIKYPLNPIEKSIIVLLDQLTKGKIQRMTSLKIVKCYYEHAEIGYELLKALAQYDETFLERVRRHHSQGKGDEVLECLKNADDLC